MEYHFGIHQQIRGNLLKVLKSHSREELLYIPDGFNNNIFWNIAHCMATQQLLHYYLTDNDLRVDRVWIDKYRKGTLPNFDVEDFDIETLAFLLKKTSEHLVNDYEDGYFGFQYKVYSTSFGVELKTIQDAIIFNNTHESMHLGYVLAQSKAILGEKL